MSSSEVSSSEEERYSRYQAPLHNHIRAKKEERDWVMISAIVAAVVGGLLVALAITTFLKVLPPDLLGGGTGSGITLVAGGAILIPAAFVIFDRWQASKNQPQPS